MAGWWAPGNGKPPDIKTRVFQSKTSSRNNPTKGTVNFRLPFVAHGRLCLSLLLELQYGISMSKCVPALNFRFRFVFLEFRRNLFSERLTIGRNFEFQNGLGLTIKTA